MEGGFLKMKTTKEGMKFKAKRWFTKSGEKEVWVIEAREARGRPWAAVIDDNKVLAYPTKEEATAMVKTLNEAAQKDLAA
jgi:hypothetical protein